MIETFFSGAAILVSVSAIYLSILTARNDQRQKRIDNLVVLYEFLHQSELSEARRAVREGDVEITLKDAHVRNVCSSFDFAATLVRHGAVDKDLFLDYWAIPLVALRQCLSPIADKDTGTRVNVRLYYKDFWWLMSEAMDKQNEKLGA